MQFLYIYVSIFLVFMPYAESTLLAECIYLLSVYLLRVYLLSVYLLRAYLHNKCVILVHEETL